MSELTVVLCSYNGAEGVDRCLAALQSQSSAPDQVVVVDDGSSDDTARVASAHGAQVVRHSENQGIGAARNSGVLAATGEFIAFVDDDCEPDRDWVRSLREVWAEADRGVVGLGGPVVPCGADGYLLGYLRRHNPLLPLESELHTSQAPLYRLRLYLAAQWNRPVRGPIRPVYSLVGANMSFRREAVLAIGGFDGRFRFGGEELDLCRRLVRALGVEALQARPEPLVRHHFRTELRDVLRRSRAYGRGSARLHRKWRQGWPGLFPGPLLVLAALLAPRGRLAALLLPQVLYPLGIRDAITSRSLAPLLDPYVRLGQEFAENAGMLGGLRDFWDLTPVGEGEA